MSAHPNSELRARRRSLGSRKSRKANTKPGKLRSGQNRKWRESPATTMKRLNREAAA